MKDFMKCAVFSCLGLGDGLLTLILSNNLKLAGDEVTTFHPNLKQLQGWFPGLPLSPFPDHRELSSFDRFFIFYEKTPWMQQVLSFCLKERRAETKVINPIATPNRDYPFWEEAKFDGRYPFADNLVTFCKTVLQLTQVTKKNGMTLPSTVMSRTWKRRVLIHPTSSKEEKNWEKQKFLRLAELLEKKGWEPAFVLSPQEKKEWPEVASPLFATFDALAHFVAESGYFIGNDSGIGHLASCLGLPTLTLCSTRRAGDFWRPSWARGELLTPSSLVPNVKGLRLRDRYWRQLITVSHVLRVFERRVAAPV
jgi:heptosyltransferase III